MVRNIEDELIIYPEVETKVGDKIEFKFCSRETWGARPPSGPGSPLKHPVSHVRFCDTNTVTSSKVKVNVSTLQELQRKHMEDEKLSDIRYNFLVGNDGTIYEGRGWHVDSDRPEEFDYLKGDCIDIAYIGDAINDDPFQEDFPSEMCEKMGFAWANYGQLDNNYVKKRFTVVQ